MARAVLRLAALSSLLVTGMGCATVRSPGPSPRFEGPLPRVALAEPELELWMDASAKLSPEESALALEESRSALASALAGRGLDAEDPTAFLLVRERGLARTSGRRAGQVIAAVGIVVVVVAVVVAAIVGAKHGGGKPSSGTHAAGTKPAPPRLHVARPAPGGPGLPGPRAGIPLGPVRGGFARRPAYAPSPWVWFGFDVYVPLEEPASPPAPPGAEEGQGEAGAEGEEPQDELIADRGFFAGDRVELTFVLQDARSGATLWQYVTREAVDPRDEPALRRLIDAALAGESWAMAGRGAGTSRPAQERQNR